MLRGRPPQVVGAHSMQGQVMNHRFKLLPVAAMLALLHASAWSSTSGIVVNQVYGGGGNSGAVYNRDFVELLNTSGAAVNIGGWSIQYTSASGTGLFGSNMLVLPSLTLQPGQYALVALASGASGANLPTPEVSGTLNMSGTAGKLLLADTLGGSGLQWQPHPLHTGRPGAHRRPGGLRQRQLLRRQQRRTGHDQCHFGDAQWLRRHRPEWR